MSQLTATWMLLIIPLILLALFIRRFILFVTRVSSDSMYPTLKHRDKILSSRVYLPHKIRRGDILIFYSEELQKMIVKRVIGLPNDFVEIAQDGSIQVNRENLFETFIPLQKEQVSTAYQVPENKYFFLGDNRAYSNDSRFWKSTFISEKNIFGKVLLVISPFRCIH